jgi:hypothetical protein
MRAPNEAMNQQIRNTALAIAILAVCTAGIAAVWFWYPGDLAAYALLLAIVVLLLLMRLAARWQLFQPQSNLPILRVKERWNTRAIWAGLICFPLAVIGGSYGVALGVRFHLVTSVPMAMLVLSPFLGLVVLGLVFIASGIFGRRG